MSLQRMIQFPKPKIRSPDIKQFFFWWHCVACGILVPQPGIKPVPPTVEVRSLNQWTAREVPEIFF